MGGPAHSCGPITKKESARRWSHPRRTMQRNRPGPFRARLLPSMSSFARVMREADHRLVNGSTHARLEPARQLELERAARIAPMALRGPEREQGAHDAVQVARERRRLEPPFARGAARIEHRYPAPRKNRALGPQSRAGPVLGSDGHH